MIEKEVKSLKVENKRIKEEIKEKEEELAKINLSISKATAELLENKEKLDITQDINEKLIKDIQLLNNKCMVLVPLKKRMSSLRKLWLCSML